MESLSFSPRQFILVLLCFLLLIGGAAVSPLRAQTPPTNNPPEYGPYNAVFLYGGDGLTKKMVAKDTVLLAQSPWSMYCWVRFDEPLEKPTLIAGMGDPTEEYPRYLAASAQHVFYWMGQDNQITAQATLAPKEWHLLAATFDGTEFHLYSDGEPVAGGALLLGTVSPVVTMAPPKFPIANGTHFGGKIAGLTILRRALSAEEIKRLHARRENFSTLEFEDGSKHWPVQTRGQAGYDAPQNPETLPKRSEERRVGKECRSRWSPYH